MVNAPGDHHFRAILEVIGRPELKDDPRLKTRTDRVVNFELVDELLETWTRDKPRNEVARLMLERSVPCAPVRNLREVLNDPNMLARGSLQTIDHPELGRVNVPHTPLDIEGVPRRPIEPSLPLGARNDEVYGRWLGHSADEIAAMKGEGVI